MAGGLLKLSCRLLVSTENSIFLFMSILEQQIKTEMSEVLSYLFCAAITRLLMVIGRISNTMKLRDQPEIKDLLHISIGVTWPVP